MLIVKPGERINKEALENLQELVNTPENPVKYLGIDPGKVNGLCGYDSKFYLMFMLTINADDMTMFMNIFKKIETCVIEGYNLYPNKAKEQIYSDMETPRVIGRVESWAELHNVVLIKQQATIKSTGYKWLGKTPLPKSNPRNHEWDAHVHFMYWAVRTGRISPADLVRNNNQ